MAEEFYHQLQAACPMCNTITEVVRLDDESDQAVIDATLETLAEQVKQTVAVTFNQETQVEGICPHMRMKPDPDNPENLIYDSAINRFITWNKHVNCDSCGRKRVLNVSAFTLFDENSEGTGVYCNPANAKNKTCYQKALEAI